ncbi:TonB [Pseudomonas tremae]|uniref:TonB n=1 Tax=Pseudomonas tremae TaxID=200454 RepID=A0AA40TU41_9PSED|nr:MULTISPECIES: energy transducer TonB [Pseudomonas syringae group]KPY95528.1 TonB [Pseudomonas tremae]RMN91183.1 TonB [Pseudomonas coronafaciens pv. coronafaciens]RMO05866.1 TonB [Pseudomonas coronafaciens pv. zizaniae]
MSTLILPRRLPPHECRSWPEPPVGTRCVAPSSLFVPPHGGNVPKAWLGNTSAILAALGLHAALVLWLTADHPQAPEPTPPIPITVQWVPPPTPPAPPSAQPTPQPPEPVAQPEAPRPAPTPPPKPAPAELPRPKAQAKSPPIKAVAKPAAQAPSAAPPAPAATKAAPAPAAAATQSTTAPIGRAGYLNNPPPVYPPAAARRHQEGTTLLRVHVLPNGRADQVQVQQSSGVPALDEAAQAAVRQWTFIPAKRGDTPVEGWVNVPLAFKLAP